jgi:serine/threonine protein kinase
MAPEAFTVKLYGLTADVWSLGCIFYEMIMLQLNKILYVDAVMNYARLREEIRNNISNRGYSDELANLVCSMLDGNPVTRYSAQAVRKRIQYLMMRGPAKTTFCAENCGSVATLYCNECEFFFCASCNDQLHQDDMLQDHVNKAANLVRTGPFPAQKIYAVGRNNHGQLGLGHNQNQIVPNDISDLEGKGIVSIISGENSTIGLTASGEVFSWGNNTYGQLGLGHSICKYEWDESLQHEVLKNRKVRLDIPNLVVALKEHRITKIAGGANHFMALTDDGRVFVVCYLKP